MAGKNHVEIYRDQSGEHRARLQNANGRIQLDFSEPFASKGNAKRAVLEAALDLMDALIHGRIVEIADEPAMDEAVECGDAGL